MSIILSVIAWAFALIGACTVATLLILTAAVLRGPQLTRGDKAHIKAQQAMHADAERLRKGTR